MKLYEISEELERAITECIDPETGEITDPERIEQLQIDLTEKVRSIGLYIINLRAEIKAIKEQEDKFTAKRKSREKRLDWLLKYIERYADGKPFEFDEFEISYKPSHRVEITDFEAFSRYTESRPEFVKVGKIEPDKTAIKSAIENGETVPGADLILKKNIQIK